MNVDREFDASGLPCPMPIVKLAQQIKFLDPGMVIRLIADDPGSEDDIPAWCNRTGNELLETAMKAGKFTFLIRKS